MENRLSSFSDQIIEASWLVSAALVPIFFNIFSSRVFEPDKLTLLRSIVFIMAAAWVVRYFTSTRTQSFSFIRLARSSPLALPVLVLAFAYLLSTALSVDPHISFWGSYVRLQGLVTNLAYLTLFFIVADRMRTRLQVDRLISVIVIVSIPISMYGLVQHFQRDPLPWGGDVTFRVTSTMGNAIFLAAYLIMVVPLTLARLVQAATRLISPVSRSGRLGWLVLSGYAVALVLQLVVILFTKSRGPWIGLTAGLFLMAILWLLRLRKRKVAAYCGAAFAACLAFVLLLNIPNSPLEPLKASSSYVERLGTILDMDSGTNRVRTLIWFGDGVGKGASGLIMESPWRTLLGHGPESMYVAYGPYYPPDLAHLEARNAAPDRSHNDLLDSLVTTGFLGLFAYLLVMVRGFSVGLQELWKEQDLARQGIIVGVLGALAAHIVESLTGIAIASTLTYTWLLLGCLASIFVMAGREAPVTSVAAQSKPSPEGRVARRQRAERKGPSRPQRGPAPDVPWFKRSGFFVLISYLVVTGAGTVLVLSGAINRSPDPGGLARALRDPDPATIVVVCYLWLVLGILCAAVWVRKPQATLGRVDGQALAVALLIGLVAVLLPIKLFLGSVIGDMYFKRGLNAASSQRSDIAISPYLTAVEWSPGEDYYFLYMGQAYLDMARSNPGDKPAQRIESLNDLLKLRDRPAQLGRENLVRASQVVLQRAQELNPLNTDHAANLGRLYRLWGEMSADASVKQEKFAQSVEHYKRATTLSPNAAHLRAEWGQVYMEKGDLQESLRQFQEGIRLDPLYAPSYAYLGDFYRGAGDHDKALEQYQKALSVHNQSGTLVAPMDVAVHASLADEYFRKGLYDLSLQEYQSVAKASPKDFNVHRSLSLIYRALEDRGKALEEARLALSLAPGEEKPSLQAMVTELQGSVR